MPHQCLCWCHFAKPAVYSLLQLLIAVNVCVSKQVLGTPTEDTWDGITSLPNYCTSQSRWFFVLLSFENFSKSVYAAFSTKSACGSSTDTLGPVVQLGRKCVLLCVVEECSRVSGIFWVCLLSTYCFYYLCLLHYVAMFSYVAAIYRKPYRIPHIKSCASCVLCRAALLVIHVLWHFHRAKGHENPEFRLLSCNNCSAFAPAYLIIAWRTSAEE